MASPKQSPAFWPQVYLSVFLTTMAALLLELSLTRIFSVVFYYHLAFLAISIALFGFGLGGVFSYVLVGWKGSLYGKLGRLSALNSLLAALALVVVVTRDNLSAWNLALVYFTAALPFFVSGVIVSSAINDTMERVNRVYLFDLLGAGAGCMLLVPLLNGLGGPSTVLASAITFAAAAAIWHTVAGSVRGRAGSVALALALLGLLTYNHRHRLIDVRQAKGHTLPTEYFERWNSMSRVGVAHRESDQSDVIYIDADAATAIARYDFDRLTPSQRRDLLCQGPGLPYAIRPGAKTLIVGPGGGMDVARAIAGGSRDVTGVEVNPLIADTVMRGALAEKSNGLYLRPEVHIQVEDGRSFIRRHDEKYQVIQATMVDTWAATAAGAFALSENYLYTTDAFRDYLTHLTDDGVAAFTRWGFVPPRESLRLVSLAMEALNQLGEREPWRHVIVAREGSVKGWGARDTTLISRKAFSQADIARARAAFTEGGMVEVYTPGGANRNPFHELLRSASPDAYERSYPFDITPVSDNRPFFFYTVQPSDLWKFATGGEQQSADYKINKAVPLLFGLMAVSVIATLLILLLPPVVLGTRLPRQKGVAGFLPYFLFIGAGYIMIEVGLIQKFVLFLGHPTYALTVVVFSLLASSGLGSAISRRALGNSESRLIKALGSIAILASALGLALSSLLTQLVGLPLPMKVLITGALVGPLGFVMGMPFPTGLKRLEDWHAPSVRWAWSLNAASSVLGSVGALVCAVYLGLIQTLVIGGLLYLAALAAVARTDWRRDSDPEPGIGRVMLAK